MTDHCEQRPPGEVGETTCLIHRLRPGDVRARNELIAHACDWLRRRSSRMLRGFPSVRRWDQTDDVMNEAVIRLQQALESVTPQSPRHFYNLAGVQIRRTLLDLARRYAGPQGHAAHHHTDPGKAADDPGGPLDRCPAIAGEPDSCAGWSELLERIEELPEEEREVFDLLWTEGRTQEEAAAVLDVSLRTIKRRWQAVRLRLRGVAC